MDLSSKVVRRVEFQATSTGVAETTQKLGALGKATDEVGGATRRITSASEQYERRLAQQYRQIDVLNRALDAQRQVLAASAQAQLYQAAAANENASAMSRLGGAARDLGTTIMDHPVKAIGVLGVGLQATSAGLGAGAVAMRGLTFESAALTGAARASASGLATGAEAAAALASRLSLTVLATKAFSTAAGYALPILGPIGAALTVFKLGAEGIEKAASDLQKLVDIGHKAQALNVAPAFLETFTGAAKGLRIEVADMEAALSHAAGVLKARFEEANAFRGRLRDIFETGYVGTFQSQGLKQFDAAAGTGDIAGQIRGAVTAMKELEELGLRLGALDLAEKLFGSKFADSLRRAKLSSEDLATALQSAGEKEIIRNEQIQRATDLANKIADVKQKISDAWAVSFDFSAAAETVDRAWLKVLETVLQIVNKMGEVAAIPPPPGPAPEKLAGLLANQERYTEELRRAEEIARTSEIPAAIARASENADRLRSILANINAELANVRGGVQGLDAEMVRERNRAIGLGRLSSAPTEDAPAFPPRRPLSLFTSADVANTKAGAAAAAEAASAVDLLNKRTEERVATLELEAQGYGKTSAEVIRLKANYDLQRAALKDGVEVSEEQRAAYDRQIDRIVELTKRTEDFKNAQQATNATMQEFGTFVQTLITGSGKLGDALKGLGTSFTNNAINALVSGQGPLAGQLGLKGENGQPGGIMSPAFFDRMSKAVSEGTSGGMFDFLGGGRAANSNVPGLATDGTPMPPTRPGDLGGLSGGGSMMSGIAAGGAGLAGAYGIGRSQGNTAQGLIGGALSGAVGGAMLGAQIGMVGGPAGAAIGAALGLGLAPLGAPSSTSQENRNVRAQRVRDFRACRDDDRRQPLQRRGRDHRL
jgi:hypothetical protein